MRRLLHTNVKARILVLFLALLIVYLAIAYLIYVPWEYYGTTQEARIGDPWIQRTRTIISGGLLYRDVFTATPPLTNYLLIIPSLIPILFGEVNPWTTLSFMLYFALFNLLTAYVLFYMSNNRAEGWQAALYFLLNPLTFGNAVLRRQDESILVFFFALAIWLMVRRHHLRAALAIGATLLVKLSGVLLIPVAFFSSRNWKYLIIPPLLFAVVLAPFLLMAGSDAIFWDFSQTETQHPFQFDGLNLTTLWYRYHNKGASPYVVWLQSALFVLGVGITSAFIAWKRFAPISDDESHSNYKILEQLTILIVVVLLLLPKLHAGYFSLLALTMAQELKGQANQLRQSYFWIGVLVILADFYKFPIENYLVAGGLMIGVYVLLVMVLIRLVWQPVATPFSNANQSKLL